jgi:hypothetical protein
VSPEDRPRSRLDAGIASCRWPKRQLRDEMPGAPDSWRQGTSSPTTTAAELEGENTHESHQSPHRTPRSRGSVRHADMSAPCSSAPKPSDGGYGRREMSDRSCILSTKTVSPGITIFKVTNTGTLQHEFQIDRRSSRKLKSRRERHAQNAPPQGCARKQVGRPRSRRGRNGRRHQGQVSLLRQRAAPRDTGPQTEPGDDRARTTNEGGWICAAGLCVRVRRPGSRR